MIKGCRKKIIYVANINSPYFEEAYFVLKRGEDIGNSAENDMVKEAQRIANEVVDASKIRAGRKRKQHLTAFLYGGAAVSLLFGVLMLIFTLFP